MAWGIDNIRILAVWNYRAIFLLLRGRNARSITLLLCEEMRLLWLLKNFDARKAARSGEIDALGKAKAVLSGADYSLVQIASKRLRGSA